MCGAPERLTAFVARTFRVLSESAVVKTVDIT
jgi:hypothetical protein